MKDLIIIGGPTGVGKTNISIELAKKINGEIISADSMQVYKRMDIGTAKITEDEKSGIMHYGLNLLEPTEEFDVVFFKKMTLDAIAKIRANNKIPIIVGGTGFYIQAVLYDIDFDEEEKDISYRKELEALAEKNGVSYIHNMLIKVDEEAAKKIHPNNVKRVIRALEYNKLTGKKISEHNEEQSSKQSPYDYCYFALNDNKEVLYERINRRVDIMMNNGLENEVRDLINEGLNEKHQSMNGIGYKEFLDYFNGELTLDEVSDKIKQNSRNYAKRQLTWLRREREVIWIDKSEYLNESEIVEKMLEFINK